MIKTKSPLSNKLIAISAGVFIIVGLLIFAYKNNDENITDFESCGEKYPVMDSYPAQCRTKSGKHFVQDIGNELEMREQILMEYPRPGQVVGSPLQITGRAVGGWYFEAQFSAQLVDDKGTVLGEGILSATSDWMTPEMVPFTGSITFETSSSKGRLILKNSNPSGLEENDKVLVVPVKFMK